MDHVPAWILAVITVLLVVCRPSAEAQESRPIGILLAAGDISNCYSSRSRYLEVADLIGEEIEKAEIDNVPISVLAVGDLAYKVTKKGVVKKTYADCFSKFIETWGKYKPYIVPVPGNRLSFAR